MEDEKQRPNEGIPLTENRIPEEGVQFYYSRERRLSKAPASVQSLYEEKGPAKFNLIRPLISNRSNAILFGTMAALALIIVAMSFSGITARGQDYYGNRISVSGVRYDGAAVIVFKKKQRDAGGAYTGPLDISVSPKTAALQKADGSRQAGDGTLPYPYRLVLSSRTEEEFRFSVPFEETELLLEISGGDDSLPMTRLAFTVKTK
jgi:hypothetical protein